MTPLIKTDNYEQILRGNVNHTLHAMSVETTFA